MAGVDPIDLDPVGSEFIRVTRSTVCGMSVLAKRVHMKIDASRCRLLVHNVVSLRRRIWSALGGIADIDRPYQSRFVGSHPGVDDAVVGKAESPLSERRCISNPPRYLVA